MPDPKLPRGAVKLAADALTVAGLLNNAGYIDGDEREAARVALTAAWPVAQRAILRDAAKLILLLHSLDAGHICPCCHGRTIYDPSISALSPSAVFRCVNGHQWNRRPNRGPFNDMNTSLRRLARGEPLPDLPPKEITDDR